MCTESGCVCGERAPVPQDRNRSESEAQILLPLNSAALLPTDRRPNTENNAPHFSDRSLPADRVGPRYFAPGARRADQSGGKNSWAGTGGHDADVIQHAGGGRDRRRDADHAGDKRVERRHLAASCAGQFRGDDRTGEKRSSLKPSDLARFLRDELRPRARRSAAPDDSVFQLSR